MSSSSNNERDNIPVVVNNNNNTPGITTTTTTRRRAFWMSASSSSHKKSSSSSFQPARGGGSRGVNTNWTTLTTKNIGGDDDDDDDGNESIGDEETSWTTTTPRENRISFDDVEKNKGGGGGKEEEEARGKRRNVEVTRQTLLVRAEDECDCDADSEEEEEKEKKDAFEGTTTTTTREVHVRKRDVVACELITTSTTTRGKKSRRKKSSPPRHRIVITSFPRRKRLIDYATLPRFLFSASASSTNEEEFKAGKENSGKRFGHKRNVYIVKYASLDEALEDVKRIEEACGLEHQRTNKRGRFLVLINPAAGRGKAEEVFKKHVEPVLKCAKNCVVDAIVTRRSGETEERTYERSKDSLLLTRGREYDNHNGTHDEDARVLGIIAIGGDGTIAEVYAGLERAQKELGTHESIPIGAIPAGSGNAISVSLAEQSREVNDATTMALLIAKGQTIRLDGARLEIYRNDENSNNDTTNHATKSNGGKRRLSLDRRNGSKKNGSSSNNTNDTNNRIAVYQNTALLSVSWGFFADVDLESERFRCLGGTRFILQAIARLINLRTYKMDLTYRVSQETKSVCERLEKSLPGRKEGEFRTIKDENILGIWAMNLPWGSSDTKSAPLASPSDGFFDIIIVHPTSKLNLLKLLLDFDTKGSHAKNEAVTYLKTSEFVLTLLGRSDLTKGVSCSTDTPVGATTNIANPLGCMDAREDPETPSTALSDLYEGGRVMIDGEVVPDVCSREDMFTVKGCVERGLADVFSFAPSSSNVISAGGSIA